MCLGVCECECIFECILGLKRISVSVCLQFLLVWGCCVQCHSVNSIQEEYWSASFHWRFICEEQLSTVCQKLRFAGNAEPACLAVTFELLRSTNAFSCQGHGRGWQHRLCPGRHPLPAAHSNLPPTSTTHTMPNKWFRFVLCSPGKKLSIQSAKWCQGFVSKAYEWQKQPTSFHSSPPSSQPKNTSTAGQEDWEPGNFIDFFSLHPHPHVLK